MGGLLGQKCPEVLPSCRFCFTQEAQLCHKTPLTFAQRCSGDFWVTFSHSGPWVGCTGITVSTYQMRRLRWTRSLPGLLLGPSEPFSRRPRPRASVVILAESSKNPGRSHCRLRENLPTLSIRSRSPPPPSDVSVPGLPLARMSPPLGSPRSNFPSADAHLCSVAPNP